MLSQLHTHVQSWWHETPLPATTAAPPVFQTWHTFSQGHWTPLASTTPSPSSIRHQWTGSLRLVTWNANADSPFPESRISALLQTLQASPIPSIIFLQEVSRAALTTLLANPWIRQTYHTSDIALRTPSSFTSITLVSKPWLSTHSIQLGAVWRIPLPSHFARDALCCDVVVNATSRPVAQSRLRLINVHLDSLAVNPSLRPRQLALCAAYVRKAGRGIVAGDFNPVMPADEDLVRANGLVDAWVALRPGEHGWTWGVCGQKGFPPCRMDRVAVMGVVPLDVGVLRAGEVSGVEVSDHSGVWCEIGWSEDGR